GPLSFAKTPRSRAPRGGLGCLPAAEASELEARAALDDAGWRDIEEVGRCTGVTRHEAEQALAPPHHRGRTGRQKSRAVHVIGRLLSLPLDAEITAEANDLPHVGPFHEPVVSEERRVGKGWMYTSVW